MKELAPFILMVCSWSGGEPYCFPETARQATQAQCEQLQKMSYHDVEGRGVFCVAPDGTLHPPADYKPKSN